MNIHMTEEDYLAAMHCRDAEVRVSPELEELERAHWEAWKAKREYERAKAAYAKTRKPAIDPRLSASERHRELATAAAFAAEDYQ